MSSPIAIGGRSSTLTFSSPSSSSTASSPAPSPASSPSRRLFRAVPLALLVAALLLVVLAAFDVVPQLVDASNVCVCECCDGGKCLSSPELSKVITLSGSSCDACNIGLCKDELGNCFNTTKVAKEQGYKARCIARDSALYPFCIVLFLFLCVGLFITACARNYHPKLKRIIAKGA